MQKYPVNGYLSP